MHTKATPTPLKVAVIGVGERGKIAQWVEGSPTSASVVAAADTSKRGRAQAKNMFGAIEIVDTHDRIDYGQIDAAIVATPDDTHAAIAIDLLEAGVATYLEKPIATTVVDADRILAVAERTGTKLYLGHNMRQTAMALQMKELIEDGAVGEVKAIWCRHFVGHGGDFYFKDWHADRSRSTSLLLQKAAHDIDFMHWIAGSYTTRVVGMGDLMVYGQIQDRRDRSGERMRDWFSLDNWPPHSQSGLNPVVDVEDLSMVLMTMASGVMGSYQQCHFTPDYWRNFTVIGTEGRLENFGDNAGGTIRVWNKRTTFSMQGDVEFSIDGDQEHHDSADRRCMDEFLEFVAADVPPLTSVLGARHAVATGIAAAESLRQGSVPFDIDPLDSRITQHFQAIEHSRV